MDMRMLAILVMVAWAARASAEDYTGFELRADDPFVNQLFFSKDACAPAALLNSLRFGGEPYQAAFAELAGRTDQQRLHAMVDRYFQKPSEVRDQGRRYSKGKGVAHLDLFAASRELHVDFQLPEISAEEPLRGLEESSEAFVRRVHHTLLFSLQSGLPPIIAMRSQFADQDSRTDQWRWKTLEDHSVTLVRIPSKLHEGAMGFSFDYIDPDGGRLCTGFLYAERRQNFAGYRGTGDGGYWLSGNRFLLISAPSSYSLIPEDKADWHARTLTVLSYYIGR